MRGRTRFPQPKSKTEAVFQCLFFTFAFLVLGVLTGGILLVLLPLPWVLLVSELGRLSKKNPAPDAVLKVEIHRVDTSSNSPYEVIQPWLTKAVNHKKAAEWDEALSCLDKAYSLAAKYPLSDFGEYSVYLRLPNYLQQAGKNDLAWKYLNEYSMGHLPYRSQTDELALDISYRAMVADRMRVFLEREKKYRAALIERAVCQFLESSRAFVHHKKCIDYVGNKRWLEQDRSIQKIDKEAWESELSFAQEIAERYHINGIRDDLWKTAKKAKLTMEKTASLAAEVYRIACNVKHELEALSCVCEVTRVFAQVIDE